MRGPREVRASNAWTLGLHVATRYDVNMTRKVILTVLTLVAIGTPILSWTVGLTSSTVGWGCTECPFHVVLGDGSASIATTLAWDTRILLEVRGGTFHDVLFYCTGRVDEARALPEILHGFGGFHFRFEGGSRLERGYDDTGKLTREEEHIRATTQPLQCFFQAPLWALITVAAVYPTVAFIRGPVRRWRRRKKGACLKCGYDLTGNVTGVCPECGTAISETPKGSA